MRFSLSCMLMFSALLILVIFVFTSEVYLIDNTIHAKNIPFQARDSDSDGIDDSIDLDDDNDGIPDIEDLDDDNDGIPDTGILRFIRKKYFQNQ